MAKVLLVDDSETVRANLINDLSKEHTIIEADNGVNGIKVLEENPDTQLIIADVNMPEMDGITMCGKIHAREEFKNIPIFILTTEFDPDLKSKGKAAGVKVWITKPVNSKKLIEIINKVTLT